MLDLLINIKEDEFLQKYFPNKDLVSLPELVGLIEDMSFQIEDLKDEIKKLNRSIEEDYKPIDKYDELGISESDFH